MTIELGFLFLGLAAGGILVALVWTVVSMAKRSAQNKIQRARADVMQEVGRILADVEIGINALRRSSEHDSVFVSVLQANIEKMNSMLKANMHMLEMYYVKYIENVVESGRSLAYPSTTPTRQGVARDEIQTVQVPEAEEAPQQPDDAFAAGAEEQARELARQQAALEAFRASRQEAEKQAAAEAGNRARAEAERRAAAEAKARQETEQRARDEAEKLARAESERKAREEVDRRAKAEAERQARAEAEERSRLEAERRAKEDAEKLAKAEAERRAHAEAERKAREESERRARAEAERKAREAAARQAATPPPAPTAPAAQNEAVFDLETAETIQISRADVMRASQPQKPAPSPAAVRPKPVAAPVAASELKDQDSMVSGDDVVAKLDALFGDFDK
jgi:hypothetical protein